MPSSDVASHVHAYAWVYVPLTALLALHAWTGGRLSPTQSPTVNRAVQPDGTAGTPFSQRCASAPKVPPSQAPERCIAEHEHCAGGDCTDLLHFYVESLAAESEGPILLSHGSLLGWFRECCLVGANDHDLDISMHPRDFSRLSINAVQWGAVYLAFIRGHWRQALDMWIVPIAGNAEHIVVRGKRLATKFYFTVGVGGSQRRPGCQVDIWIKHSNGTHFTEFTSEYGGRSHAETIRPVQQVRDFPGLELYAPYPVEGYLVERFGEGWRVPVGQPMFDDMSQSLPFDSDLNAVYGAYNECTEVGNRTNMPLFYLERGATIAVLLWLLAVCVRRSLKNSSE